MPAGSSSHRYTGRRLRWVGMIGLTLLWMTMAAPPAAATVAESDLVWIVEGEVVPEDLYAVGNEVRIAGRVEGDLFALATDVVLVEGIVTGSVTALASRVLIEGEVGGSVVAGASEVEIAGHVGGDVVAGALSLDVRGEVERDILAAVWYGVAMGSVGRDLKGLFRSLDLGGQIAGDVEIRTDRLDAGAAMSVLGDVDYQAAHIYGQEYLDANVKGSVVNRQALPANIRVRAFRLMVVLLMSLLTVLGGLVIVRVLSTPTEAAVGRMVAMPLRSLGKGLIFLLSPLLVPALMGVVILALPLHIWGPLLLVVAPFLVVGAGAWLLAALCSHIPVAVATGRALGNLFGRNWESGLAYLVGAALFLPALQVPAVGLLLAGVVTTVGAGGWLGKSSGRSAVPAPARDAPASPLS